MEEYILQVFLEYCQSFNPNLTMGAQLTRDNLSYALCEKVSVGQHFWRVLKVSSSTDIKNTLETT